MEAEIEEMKSQHMGGLTSILSAAVKQLNIKLLTSNSTDSN
jgi:hypothetical protein